MREGYGSEHTGFFLRGGCSFSYIRKKASAPKSWW